MSEPGKYFREPSPLMAGIRNGALLPKRIFVQTINEQLN